MGAGLGGGLPRMAVCARPCWCEPVQHAEAGAATMPSRSTPHCIMIALTPSSFRYPRSEAKAKAAAELAKQGDHKAAVEMWSQAINGDPANPVL